MGLPELIDIIIESGAKLFVSAVGVPPKYAVDKLHAAGIPVMNMIGHPKHVKYALDAGVDIICAQGGEGGGHTGHVATSLLIPKVVDLCKGKISPLTGDKVHVVAAGGIYDGRGLAMSLCQGADAVWVGTRFVAAKEAGAPPRHQNSVVSAGYSDTIRTVIYTGRPLRIRKTNYAVEWEKRPDKIRELTSQGIIPVEHDMMERMNSGKEITLKERMEVMPLLMGQTAGAIESIESADDIIQNMMKTCIQCLRENAGKIVSLSGGAHARL